jgi:hypothetical protein
MQAQTRNRALVAAFYGVLVALLAYYLRGTDWGGIAALQPNFAYLVAAVPLSLATRLAQPIAWSMLIRGYGERVPPYGDVALVYAKSSLGRYVPGKLAWVGAKVLFGQRLGIGARTLALASFVEAGLQTVTALALACALLMAAGEFGQINSGVRGFAVATLVLCSAALVPAVFNAAVARMLAILGRDIGANSQVTAAAVLQVVGLYVAVHLLGAAPLYLLLKALNPGLEVGTIPYVTASFLLAGSLGTLAVFAPSGIGVREGLLLLLLGTVLPKEVTVVGVMFLRVWSIGMDLLFLGLAALLAPVLRARRADNSCHRASTEIVKPL